MFNQLKELFYLLTPDQRVRFYKLQFLVVCMAVIEVLGVAMMGPFMAVVGDESLIYTNEFALAIFNWFGFTEYLDFLFFLGVILFFTLGIGALVSIYTVWRLSLFGAQVGTEVGDRLYKYYLNQSWLFHMQHNSSLLTKQISTETVRLTDFIVMPLMQMNARIVLAMFILTALVVYDPVIAFSGFMLFALAYLILYKYVRVKLTDNGWKVSKYVARRFEKLSISFGGIREVILLGRAKRFEQEFVLDGDEYAKSRGMVQALSIFPRYFMEFIAFGSIIFLILFLIKFKESSLESIFPLLAVYALAGLKLLPAFQQIYHNMALIKGNIAAYESIKDDLRDSQRISISEQQLNKFKKNQCPLETRGLLEMKESIEFKSVSFSYPGFNRKAISDLNISFPVNQTLGIVGFSGSGKSTLVDLLLGLIEPDEGQLAIDGQVLPKESLNLWRKSIGFVPQSIFLYDATMAENIAFGVPLTEVDMLKLEKAIKLSHLDELVSELPEGVHTKVGERGVQLSGGQRQRIGIARALYYDASVLVLDEATSALDSITEKMIMESVNEFSGQKTIIMIAHRLSTVKNCDHIYMLEKGSLVDSGTYDQLYLRNERFKKMVLSI
jgi:HlyD family secretion protein